MSFWGLRHLPGRVQPFAALLLAPLQQVPQPRLRLATVEATAEAMGGPMDAVGPGKKPGKTQKNPGDVGKKHEKLVFLCFF